MLPACPNIYGYAVKRIVVIILKLVGFSPLFLCVTDDHSRGWDGTYSDEYVLGLCSLDHL